MESTAENFSIVPDEEGKAILLVRDGEGWSLPRHGLHDPAAVNDLVLRRFGVRVSTRDRLPTGARRRRSSVFVHDTRCADRRLPARARWFAPADAAAAPLPVAEHRELLSRWSSSPDSGPPWTRRGWFARAENWSCRELADRGAEPTGPAEQLSLRAWSGQLRVPTTTGLAYLKASPPAFGHEAALTEWLARRHPGLLPRVIATRPEDHWLLTADFGTHAPASGGPDVVDTHLRAAPHLADVQLATAAHADDLLRLGCPDHRLAVLPELLRMLIRAEATRDTAPAAREVAPAAREVAPAAPDRTPAAPDTATAAPDRAPAAPDRTPATPDTATATRDVATAAPAAGPGEPALSPAELDRLVAFVPSFARRCAALAACGVPETVVHHDIWRGNVATRPPRIVIFDWAESVLGHPFFSLDVVLRDVRAADPGGPAENRVRDAYLARWDLPQRTLRRAARLAVIPALVSRASMWKTAIDGLDGTHRAPFAGTVTAHLRTLLREIEAGSRCAEF